MRPLRSYRRVLRKRNMRYRVNIIIERNPQQRMARRGSFVGQIDYCRAKAQGVPARRLALSARGLHQR